MIQREARMHFTDLPGIVSDITNYANHPTETRMAATNHWTRDQLLVAFSLYSQLPFGKLHARNPDIIDYAARIHRTPSALAMKLVNIASLDPFIIGSGRSGLNRVVA